MTASKNIQIDIFLPYMRDVSDCAMSLRELAQMWRMIEMSAKMNCPQEAHTLLPTMTATRSGLGRLEKDLVQSLVSQKVGNVLEAIGTKAQYVIDLVVRNLFERTADVGFLATDRELCAFVAQGSTDVDAVRHRLQQYRDKYSVYEEIMLLDAQGNVLVQLNPENPVEGTRDPLLAEALKRSSYVEVFRATDLRPHKTRGLVYAHRMESPGARTPVGVLCLCFGFEEEMARIFRSHRDPEGRSLMLLLDQTHQVIASSDPEWVRPGVAVPVSLDGKPRCLVHGGREYLVRTFQAKGYQGYPGPDGWLGQVMIPVELAFSGMNRDILAELDPDWAAGLLSHARTFSPPLFELITATESIRRVVWNGQVVTAGKGSELQKLKSILEQVSETGNHSQELFAASIHDLYGAVLDSDLNEAEFASLLLVDLLDRNLYERANDCRWWALTPEIQAALTDEHPGDDAVKRVQAILAYIHGLYTVYSGIFVYDRHGTVVAGSVLNDSGDVLSGLLGTSIDPDMLKKVGTLTNHQSYAVSAFAPTPLYQGQSTYVYHAALRDVGQGSKFVGGIAVVFDAQPQLAAMLHESFGYKPKGLAFYLDRQARVLSSADPSHPIGSVLEIDADLLALPRGTTVSRIVQHDGQYAIMGLSVSQGYREFKNSDGYQEDVLAVVFNLLGEVRPGQALLSSGQALGSGSAIGGRGGQEFATFFSGGGLFGLPAEHLSEALSANALSARSTMSDLSGRVGLLAPQKGSSLTHFVWVFDLGYILYGRYSVIDNRSQIVIVRCGAYTIGLLVDELHAVPEFVPEQIMPVPFDQETGTGKLVKHLVKANEQTLVQLIDTKRLFESLLGHAP